MELQRERRAQQDRRNHLTSPRFPFVDGQWKIISDNRRIMIEDRRIEDSPIDEEKILKLLKNINKGVVKIS